MKTLAAKSSGKAGPAIDRILVAVDLAKHSETTALFAAQVAQSFDADLNCGSRLSGGAAVRFCRRRNVSCVRKAALDSSPYLALARPIPAHLLPTGVEPRGHRLTMLPA
jgi:hypothetical protein